MKKGDAAWYIQAALLVILLLAALHLPDSHVRGSSENATSAIVVLCFNRPRYLERSLASVKQRWIEDYKNCIIKGEAHNSTQNGTASVIIAAHCRQRFPVFVSQDGDDKEVSEVASRFCYENKIRDTFNCKHLIWHRQNQNSNNNNNRKNSADFKGKRKHLQVYHHIALHYYKILYELFEVHNFDKVIILEDDMELAVDFLN